jgi:hypothetical protein
LNPHGSLTRSSRLLFQNLYEVMLKCIEFANEPDDESEGPEPINIVITTHDGKTLRLELEPDETIGAIKDAISDGCGLTPDKQVLQFQAKELGDNTKSLQELGIQNGATLTVEPRKVDITITTWDGQKLNVTIDPTRTLAKLKLQLEKESGLTADNMKLSMNGIPLIDDDNPAEFFGIGAGSTLHLEPSTFRVKVELPDGSTHPVDIASLDTTDVIKSKIQAATGMLAARQVPSFNGKELLPNATAKEMGLVSGSSIQVGVFRVPVTVTTIDGEQIQVLIDPTESLAVLKAQVEKDSGVPAANQRICIEGVELADDDKAVSDYGIKAGSVLDMEPKSVKVTIKLPDGTAHTIRVEMSDICDTLKAKIEKATGMAVPTQVLKVKGAELPDKRSAKDMGIREGSTIDVHVLKVPVTVKTMDNKLITIMVDPTERLGEVKKQLETESGVAADSQKLFLKGVELVDDEKTAADYGIKAGSELDLESKSITVTVHMPDGKTHAIKIAPSDTLDVMKGKINTATGMAAPRQVLYFNDEEILNGKSAKDIGLQEGSTIYVEIFRVPVTVNIMDGTQINMLIDPSEKLFDIKKQLEVETYVWATNQTLYMNSKELDDDEKLAEGYCIKSGSVLDLEPKVMSVSVKMPDGQVFTIGVAPSDTSEKIRDKIEAKTDMAASSQVVTMDGKQLPDGMAAKLMGVRDGSSISVHAFTVPVIVKTMDGRKLEIMVDPTDTLSAIKELLEAESGISAANQKIFLKGTELVGDNTTAADYGIEAGSILDLQPKVMTLKIVMPDGTTHKVETTTSDTGETIKAKIEATSGMTVARQVLKADGKVLPNGKSSKDMGIQDGTNINVEVFKIPITVTTMEGQVLKINIDPTETLGNIKKELASESGISANNQKLFMNVKELANDNLSATAHGIKAGSELDMEPKTINVNVEMADGQAHQIDIAPSDTRDIVKAKIKKQTGMAAPRQVLMFGGKELHGDKTIKEMGIRDGSSIKVGVYNVRIVVKTKDGQELSLDVEPTEMLESVKKTLQKLTGIELQKQCLKFGKNELANDKHKISEYGIKGGSVLTLEPHTDSILFVDVKCGTLFAVDREDVIEKKILTPNQGNKLDFLEAAQDTASKDKILRHMKSSPKLGVATQVVVQAVQVEDYDLEEAEKVKSKWGVSLKKREKNIKGEEFIFVDVKTGASGELSRKKYVDMGFITPIITDKGESLAEGEADTQLYDKYVNHIRSIFGVQLVT